MKQNGKTFLSEFIADRKKRRRALKVTFLLSVLIIPAIFWGFRFTGVTLSGEDPTFCGIEEHVHSAECIAAATETGEQPALASEPHVHTAECYETERVLLCEEEERADHEHSAAAGCYEEDAEADLICTTPEEGHTHTEDCYETTEVLVCGLEEGEVVATETTSESASPAEAGAANQETVYTCGQKEHVHISECYSNKEADLETAAIWEETFADVELTGDWGEDLLAIALTQIGYRESSANYELVYKGENTVKQGYTRYGQWYGAPYSDWCAMFVSFVLHYADIPQEAVPYHAGCYSWVEEFEELELYQAVDSPLPQSEDAEAQEVEEPYLPQPGDIIFFDVEDNGLPGHVGIVEDVIDKQSGESLIDILTEAEAADEELDLENDFELELHTIEGNSANMVRRKTYELRDPVIHGYVSLDQAYEQYLELLILRGETLPGFDLEPGDTLINLSATTAEGVTVELNGPTSSFGLPEDVPAADLELRLTVEELFDPADEEQSRDSLIEDYSDEIMEEETAEARIAAVFAALDAELEKADESSSDTKIEERLFAISLRNKEEKIEPTAPVSLTFSGIDTESTAEVKVYQIDADDNTVKDMDAGVNDNGDIELVADDLSLQAVTMTTGISPLQETDPNRHNTTDSRADGITINLFDYWLNTSSDNGTNNGNIGINAGKIFKFISSRTSGSGAWNAWTQGAITYPNILNRTLGTDGYPILNSTVTGNTQSLAYLFDEFDADDIRDSVQAWKRAYLNVNHLLEKTGDYYKFDSQHNFAYYDVSQGDGGDFYVHKDTYSVPDSGGTTVPVGFFPFNEYNSVQSSNNNLGYGNYYDHLFGLSLEADFLLSPTAKDSNGEDLIFTFSGDDDAWVFIDDVLVMDVGGIHDKMGGSINFATGVVKVDGRADTTIAQRFSEAGRTWTRSATEYTEHTIKFYYFERGANQSNLKMDFNIPTFTKQDLEISKNISGEGSEIDPNTEYRFQLELSQGYQKNDEFTTYTGPAEYDDGTQVSFDGDGSFSLKAGQTIIIKDIIDLKYYKLKELDFDSDAFSYVLFNGEAILPDGDNNVSAPATQARGNLVVDFENVIAEDPVDIVVKKLWSDGNINHTTDEITFQLLDANNSPITVYGENTFTLSAANNWTIKFTDIPAIFADLSTVEEIDVPDGYEVSYDKRISEDDDVTIIITNREEPVPGTISVSKKWYQQDGTLLEGPPENDVQVQLMQKGTVEDSGSGSGEEHTVTFRLKVRGDGWSVVYLPIGTKTVPHGESLQFAFGYNLWGTQWNESYAYPEAGNRVNDAVGTHTFGSGLTANVYEVTNVTQNTTIDLITWWYGTSDPGIRDDFLEDKINNLQTFYDPETYPPSTGDGGTTIEVQAYGQPITLNEANNWQGKWGNLPATDDNGNPYSYFIEEVTIGGEPAGFTDYEIDYVNNDGIEYGHITVKNTAPVNYGYELPETGGRGISAYLIGGIFLMALIPFYKYIDHKKRKRYES